MKNRRLLALLSCGLISLLAACASNTVIPKATVGEEALKQFGAQDVRWEPCDTSIFSEQLREPLQTLGERLECATLNAPLDWATPELGEINLGILRVKAGDEANRQGAIFVNPGGPGGDGLEVGALLGLLFASNGGAAFGFEAVAPELFGQISKSYDIVGFSPRGVGGSFRLYCGTNKAPPKTNFYTDRSPENVQALLSQGQLAAEACLNNPLSAYISTEQTVHDLNLVRTLLGDEKLNFLGYSYGSWLGVWYAKRFPKNTGRMVLDANLDFTAGFQEASLEFVRGFERTFREVVLAFVARNDAVFGLGSSADEVYEVYDTLPRELKAVLVGGRAAITQDLYSSRLVGNLAVDLVAARGVDAVLRTFGEPVTEDTFGAFAEALANFTYAENTLVNEAARAVALMIGEDYRDYLTFLSSRPGPVELGTSGAVNTAVICNDSVWNQDPTFWAAKGDEENRQHPLLGGSLTVQPCAFWGGPNTRMPKTPGVIPPLLMVQTGFDAATPSEGALRAFASLPDARLVYLENEMSHTTFPYNTACVDARVAAFLLDGSLPEADISNCEAAPLPGEAQVYPPGGVLTPKAAGLSVQATLEPVKRNPLYDLLHQTVRDNAADFFTHD